MKCVELRVWINVPDDYDTSYPMDLLGDSHFREDMEVVNAQVDNVESVDY